MPPVRRSLYPVRARHRAPSRAQSPTRPRPSVLSSRAFLSLPGRRRHSPLALCPPCAPGALSSPPVSPRPLSSRCLCTDLRSPRPSEQGRGGQSLQSALAVPRERRQLFRFKVFLREAGRSRSWCDGAFSGRRRAARGGGPGSAAPPPPSLSHTVGLLSSCPVQWGWTGEGKSKSLHLPGAHGPGGRWHRVHALCYEPARL